MSSQRLGKAAISALTIRLAGMLSSEGLEDLGMSFSRQYGQYQLRLPSDAWIDIESGNSALDRAEAAVRNGEARNALGPAVVAATIARRPFLPGVEGFWWESLQGKLDRQLVRALDCLGEMQLEMGEPQTALESALEGIRLDPYRERTHRCLMRAYAATGNRAKAVAAYYEFRELLANDVGTDPESETEALYLEILG
jgi:DNA-binding SARP family transcriptional activator